MIKLLGVDGYAAGHEIPIGSFGIVLGRDSADTPQLRGDNWLSNRHAQIGWSPDRGLMIRDLGSTNGTFVNGNRVQEVGLSPGDQIEVGSTVFRVEGTPAGASRQPAASRADVEIAGGLRVERGGVAVTRDARDIHSSSATAGDRGFAVGRDYVEGDTIEFDPTGFRTARGFARLFLVVGTLVALAGFGMFGYMMLESFGSFQDVMAQHTECDRNFPLGPERIECNLNIGSPTIAFVPWGAAGATVMFAGMVVYSIGTMMNRNTDRRVERARRRARGGW